MEKLYIVVKGLQYNFKNLRNILLTIRILDNTTRKQSYQKTAFKVKSKRNKMPLEHQK